METLEIALDESGNEVVVLLEIIFSNKQKTRMNMPVQNIRGDYLWKIR